MTEKTVPYNLEAEAAILGSLLIDPEAYARVCDTLNGEHFYLQKHRWVWDACRAIRLADQPLDYLTITTELDKRGQLEQIGGAVYISQLFSAVPSALHVESYARIVLDAYKRRQVLDIVTDVARLAHNEKEDIGSAADYLQARLAELIATQRARTWQPFSELAPLLPDIKWLWQSWIPSSMLTLLGAVAGAGKSMIALDLCKAVMHGQPFPNGGHNPHKDGANVIYVDAEVVPQLIKERAERWKMNTKRLFLMLPRPNDMIDFSRPDYREMLRNMTASIKPKLIVIDSLSSITSKGENAIEDVRAILGFLNELAANNDTAVMVIHHLRKRNGMQAQTSDLTPDDFRGSTHIIAMARSVQSGTFFGVVTRVLKTQIEYEYNGKKGKFSRHDGGPRWLSDDGLWGRVLFDQGSHRLLPREEIEQLIAQQQKHDEVRRLAGHLHRDIDFGMFSEEELRTICQGVFLNASKFVWYQVPMDVLRMMHARMEEKTSKA